MAQDSPPEAPPEATPDQNPSRPLRLTTRGSLVILAVLAVVWTLSYAATILIPLTAALLLSALFKPLVRWVHRKLRLPAPVTAVVLVGGMFLLVTGPLWSLTTPAWGYVTPDQKAVDKIQSELGGLREPIDRIGTMWGNMSEAVGMGGDQQAVAVKDDDNPMVGTLATTTGSIIAGLVMTMILTLFMLSAGDAPGQALVHLAPSRGQRGEAVEAIREVERDVSRYLVTLTLINLGVAVATGLAMWLIGMPNPILLGLVAGVFNFVPYLGAFAAFIIIGLASLVAFDHVGYILLAPGAFVVINTLEAYIISPMIYGNRLSIHPLMVLLALIFFGWVWGVPGTLMAVPMLVCIKIACSHVEALYPIAAILESAPQDTTAPPRRPAKTLH